MVREGSTTQSLALGCVRCLVVALVVRVVVVVGLMVEVVVTMGAVVWGEGVRRAL